MSVYIAVVSHGHGELIHDLGCLKELISDFKVIIKSNKFGDDFHCLINQDNFYWIDSSYGLGFGENNNYIFDFCTNELEMKDDDYFVVLNPDVLLSSCYLTSLIEQVKDSGNKIAAINLFKDSEFLVYDMSIRHFPNLLNFAQSFLGMVNDSIIDKSEITKPTQVDWAAGSFLLFKVSHYKALGGFDEKYFMYCEDIDICFRSNILGEKVTYYPNVKAIHLAKHANRKIFSKHFYWHVKSLIRFLSTVFWFKHKAIMTNK
ncbi:Rhamnosyltransferase WbbL [Vibrio vulnificus]|uniref:glycosyltransferase family 2 protein n=1 Tax=Vibrio vulnificus TaxID=672 RepID=UPI0009295A4C|nr:glycosyltransferase family 2 protein [Vibrio vulnificus]OJI34907.1 Rhamnosyltransferase WbbL [Vibrio vulnificus]HAS6173836.1 glycosyltransferase family 2 protein [Vibrio vulnificus]